MKNGRRSHCGSLLRAAITPLRGLIFTRLTKAKMPATITIDRGDCESVDGKKEWSGKSMAQFEDAFSCAICCEVYTDPVRWPCADDAQCSHSFCRLCAFSALQRDSSASSCPMCRAPAERTLEIFDVG